MVVFGIQRAERFSPNSVEKDRAILEAVLKETGGCIIREDELNVSSLKAYPEVVFSMARDEKSLKQLDVLESHGSLVINSPKGVRQCMRSALDKVMRLNGIPLPEADEGNGWWLKRGDGSAQSKGDVVFCKDKDELESAQKAMAGRGITEIIVQPHVAGDLVKFYGVEGTGFFRTFYPGDDGMTKFGDERHNGKPHHYPFSMTLLQSVAEKTSQLVDVPVYGGDAIIRSDGSFVIIDFNDWPSFSRCRQQAADAIVRKARISINI